MSKVGMKQAGNILVVDDELDVCELLGIQLTSQGYHVTFAEDGVNALKKAAELTPDLILLDAMLPQMDGFEVCRRLRADPVLAEVPVVMVTALNDRDSLLRGIEAGVDDFISKPFDLTVLLARVRAITRLNRYRRLLGERAKFESLIELSPDGIMMVDAEGKIRLANSTALGLLGAGEAEAVIGSSLSTFIDAGEAQQFWAYLDGINVSRLVRRIETTMIGLQGKRIQVEVNAGQFVWGDKPMVQMVVRDIAKRKQAEQALRASEEALRRSAESLEAQVTERTAELQVALGRAQEVDQLKSQLFSTVSHELRTPLTSIRGQISTLLDYADRLGLEDRNESLRIIDDEAARLDELIGHLLDMSRLEAGTLRVQLVVTDLRPIVLQTVGLMAARAGERQVAAELPTKLPLVHADPRRVRQVVSNLLDNAVKFSPTGSTITIGAKVVPSAVVVSVSDEGPGIAPEHLAHIFDRFYRVEECGIRVSGGGLGLAICKGLVEAMGGHIEIASQLGHGATFSFSLPRYKES